VRCWMYQVLCGGGGGAGCIKFYFIFLFILRNFIAFRTILFILGTQLKMSTAYHKQTDGQAEPANPTIEDKPLPCPRYSC
jgi:hypothetical protein